MRTGGEAGNGAASAEEAEAVRRRVFAGAHVFSPELLAQLDAEPADFVGDLYEPLIRAGERIDAVESNEPWFDIGTPKRYLDAVIGWAGRGGWRRRGWWSPEADVSPEAVVETSVIEAGARVARRAGVRRSLVLSGASVGEGCQVIDSVIGFSVDLPAGTVVENRLVSEARADTPPPPEASVVGGLIYQRLIDSIV